MKEPTFKDESGCCGCLFIIIMFWLTLITAVGGYKLFMWVYNL